MPAVRLPSNSKARQHSNFAEIFKNSDPVSKMHIAFGLLVACGTLFWTTGAVSISNIGGNIVVRQTGGVAGVCQP